MAQAAGHDINYIAMAGVLSQIGTGDSVPIPPLNLVADFGGGGLLAAFGIVSALFERTRSEKGQHLDAAMIDGAASLMSSHYSTNGELSAPGAVGAIEPQFFAALCAGTGLDLVGDQMNQQDWPQQIEAFERKFAEADRDHWEEVFTRLDACVSPVLDLEEAPMHPHNQARNSFPVGPEGTRHVAPAPRFSRTPAAIRRAAPSPAEHRDEILLEAGFDRTEIKELERAGAFGGKETS